MSSELREHFKKIPENKNNFLNAEVINFPNERNFNSSKDFKKDENIKWQLYDNSNSNDDGDQLRAVIGICFMFAALFFMGLYSSLI